VRRQGTVLLFATALSGCDDWPSDAQLRRVSMADAPMPDCATLQPGSFTRDEGDGWQGGGYTVRAAVDPGCAAHGRTRLVEAGFRCPPHCNARSDRGGIAINFGRRSAAIYTWSLT